MPLKNLYLRDADGCLELITPRGFNNAENNVFDKAFNVEGAVDMEEWNDWMRWEGGVAEIDPVMERKHSSGSVCSQDNWASDVESAGFSNTYLAENSFSFEDAPFELEETTKTAPGIQIGFEAPQDVRRSFRGYSSLTAEEEQSLQAIAMPFSQVKLSSEPASPTASHSSASPSPFPSPEPETRTRKNKRRKSSVDDEDVPSALCQSRKRGHNAIEKRYRTNLNDKINCLRQGVPALCRTSSSDSKSGDEGENSDGEGLDSKTGQPRYGKAAILTRALEYIKHLETTTQRLGSEVTVLKTRVGAFEKLAMSGSIILSNNASAAIAEPMVMKSETLLTIQAGKSSLYNHRQ